MNDGITDFCTACGGLCAACLIADLYRKLDTARTALAWYADATRCHLVGDSVHCTYDDGERARRALAMIGEEHL